MFRLHADIYTNVFCQMSMCSLCVCADQLHRRIGVMITELITEFDLAHIS